MKQSTAERPPSLTGKEKPAKKFKKPSSEKLRAMGLECSISLIAFALSIVTGGIILAILGVNPLTAYASLFKGALGTPSAIAGTVNRMMIRWASSSIPPIR